MKTKVVNINEALRIFKLDVAFEEYTAPKWIADKQKIADSLGHYIINDDLAYFFDIHNGQQWLVYRDTSNDTIKNLFRCHKQTT